VDRALFDEINGWPDGLQPVMAFFTEATNYLVVKVLLAAFVLGMILLGGKWRAAAIFALLGFLLANAITDVLKHLWPVLRPCQEISYVWRGIGCSNNPGTASAHSANMAATAFAFTYFTRAWGIPWIAVAILTGISRVYVGAHYPSQVLLGWLAGVVAAFILIKTWEAYRKLGSREAG
jgi:membrane-associated phospholipid phosphatase